MSTRNERREGQRILQEMLPKARELVAGGGYTGILNSDVARAQAPYLQESNLHYVTVTKGELGGWIADVWLREVPPGVAQGMGTPVARPFPTREEALDALTYLIAAALSTGKTAKPAPIYFEFFEAVVELDPDTLAHMRQAAPDAQNNGAAQMAAFALLDQMTETLWPGRNPSFEDVQGAEGRRASIIASTLAAAAITGVFRYPRPPAAPVGRYPTSINLGDKP